MAKPKSITNKVLYSRVSYLYQAAAFLAAQSQKPSEPAAASVEENNASKQSESKGIPEDPVLPCSRNLLSDLRAVSLPTKNQAIRMSPAMRQTICKRCHTLLVDGSTCSVEVENKSKGGKKEWADVLVRTCKKCNFQKRIPFGAKRQKRRSMRNLDEQGTQAQKVSENVS